MRAMLRAFAAGLMVAGLLGAGAPAAAQDSRYSAWGGGSTPEVQAFLDRLNALIDEATRAKAADPVFLQDLRDLVNEFQNPWQVRVLHDDFRDGNFTRNPAWTVSAGQFSVDTKGGTTGLKSAVAVPGAQAANQNLATAILGALLQPQGAGARYASIYTPVALSNAFAIRLELVSGERVGRIDFGPYQGASGAVAYRLAYLPGAAQPLQLQRVTSKGTAVIASSSQPLNLEDGRPHSFDWTRDRSGRMVVAVDGQPVIDVVDTGIRQPFDGFLVINSGGTYWVRSVTIDGTAG